MKNIKQLVNPDLTESVKSYDRLSDFVYGLLYLNKNKHNLWVVAQKQQLTILTDNPYLGSQIRYQQETIRDELNKKFLLGMKTVQVKIVPPSETLDTVKEPRFKMGKNASSSLLEIANGIEDDELRKSLKALANSQELDA